MGDGGWMNGRWMDEWLVSERWVGEWWMGSSLSGLLKFHQEYRAITHKHFNKIKFRNAHANYTCNNYNYNFCLPLC